VIKRIFHIFLSDIQINSYRSEHPFSQSQTKVRGTPGFGKFSHIPKAKLGEMLEN
jgi:hypothetical protein